MPPSIRQHFPGVHFVKLKSVCMRGRTRSLSENGLFNFQEVVKFPFSQMLCAGTLDGIFLCKTIVLKGLINIPLSRGYESFCSEFFVICVSL